MPIQTPRLVENKGFLWVLGVSPFMLFTLEGKSKTLTQESAKRGNAVVSTTLESFFFKVISHGR